MKVTLKSLREENRKTAAEVATVLGVANSTYYNYEQGTRRISLEQVLKLAEIYNYSTEEIIRAQLNSEVCKNEKQREETKKREKLDKNIRNQ